MTNHLLENRELRLELQQGDRHLMARLVVKATGFASPFVPLITLQIHDRMQVRQDTVDRYEVLQCEPVEENTLHVIVRDVFRRITVGLWLKMTDDDLSILFPPTEVEEANERLYRLFAAKLLPGLIGAGADGKVLLPLASGVLFSPAGKPALSDRFLIYGEQERWELLPTMPVCAAQGGGGGWLALGVQGATDMYCEVETDGKDGATVGLYPMLRRQWPDPVDWTQREIRIQSLAAGDDLVNTAGQRLRRHVIEDLKMPSLAQRAEESPECAYQQRSYTMKLFHGIQQQGIMMEGREAGATDILYKRTLTFADAVRNFHKLKDAGIDRIAFQSVGWNPRGHDGAWPTDFPIDRRLGGESGFRMMIDEAKNLGFHITTHLNMMMAAFSSPDFKPDWMLHDIWGEPKVTGAWAGGPDSIHWGLAIPEEFIRKRFLRLKEMGFNGMQYLDFMGNPLYVNYHPIHRGARSAFAEGTNRILRIAREIFGAVGIEMGFLYCATFADSLAAGDGGEHHLRKSKPEWPVTSLIQEVVPVWNLALHDLVTKENQGLSWSATMKAILLGEVPRDEWSAEGEVMPILDDERIAKLKARYDLCCCEFGHLVTQQLVSWKRLAPAAEETTYADGTHVLADFGNERLTVNGKDVPRPLIFS